MLMKANVSGWLFEAVMPGHYLIKFSEYNISLTGVGREGYLVLILSINPLRRYRLLKTVRQWLMGIGSLLKNCQYVLAKMA